MFAFMFVVHIIFSWTSIISWLLFVVDLGVIGFMTMRAYKDGECTSLLPLSHALTIHPAENLDRYEVPFFGSLANSILDDE